MAGAPLDKFTFPRSENIKAKTIEVMKTEELNPGVADDGRVRIIVNTVEVILLCTNYTPV